MGVEYLSENIWNEQIAEIVIEKRVTLFDPVGYFINWINEKNFFFG